MDSFYSINQVNVNKQTCATNVEDVDSFNHVVCYDSEFREGSGVDAYVVGDKKRIDDISENKLLTKSDGNASNIRTEVYGDLFGLPSKTFKAFTETVEALALQQSVIGKTRVVPASEEEVSRVVAETKKKLKKGVTFSNEIVCFEGTVGNSFENKEQVLKMSVYEAEGSHEDRAVDTKLLVRPLENAVASEGIADGTLSNDDNVMKLVRIPSKSLKTERQVKSKLAWNTSPKERPALSPNQDSELKRNILLKSFSYTQGETKHSHVADAHHSERSATFVSYGHPSRPTPTSSSIINITRTIEQYGGHSDESEMVLKYEALLKERAHLEGRVDILQQENKELLENRSELKTQVADLSRRICKVGVASEKSSLEDEVVALRTHRARLEAVILDAHKLISEKNDELQSYSGELEQNKNLISKLEGQVLQGKTEVQSLDTTIRDLKSKITEFYVELQTTNQNRILSENEAHSLQGELKAVLAAKEWYKEQLALCQKDKSELQTEMTSTKSEMIRQTMTIEKLKAENMRTKVNLNEIEQKLLSEKLSLARHLEAIEAEMLEREALLMQSNKEYLTFKMSDQQVQSCDVVENVDSKESSEDDEQLVRCRTEMERLRVLHEETAESLTECRRKCMSLQNVIAEKDRVAEEFESERSSLVEQMGQLKLKVVEWENKISAVEHEKGILQMDLMSTKEEKKVIDESLMTLKQNLKVVEGNFHAMKDDLINKSDELDTLRKQLEGMSVREDFGDHLTFREIANQHFDLLLTSPSSSLTQPNVHQSISTQTSSFHLSGDREDVNEIIQLKAEKEEYDRKLMIITDQIRSAQDRHKLQLNALYGVERELEDARKEIAELKDKLKEADSESTPGEVRKDGAPMVDQLKKRINQHNHDQKVRRSTESMEPHKVRHALQGSCPLGKSGPTHFEGLDSRDARLIDDQDSVVLSLQNYENVEPIKTTMSQSTPQSAASVKEDVHTLLAINTSAPRSEVIVEATQSDQHHRECEGNCWKSLDLEKRLSDLKQKLLEGEKKAAAAEQQRNKVIFLEDQLDQVNQSRELDEIKHKGEVERLMADLSSVEVEVQRLQEEVLLSKFNFQNSSHKESSENLKNVLLESSKKKFYGARLFEFEEPEPSTAFHGDHMAVLTSTEDFHASLNCDQTIHPESTSSSSPKEEGRSVEADVLHQSPADGDNLLRDQEQLEGKIELLLQERTSLAKEISTLTSHTKQLSEENALLQTTLTRAEVNSSQEADQHQHIVLNLEQQLYELRISIQNERNIMIQNFSLELEKEKGRLLELLNSQNVLKEHATKLEESLATKECSVVQMGSQAHDELKTREQLENRIKILEESVAKEQNLLKESKKAMLTEKGNNVKLKLDMEEMSVHSKQLRLELTSLQRQLIEVTERGEALKQSSAQMTVEVERLTSDIKLRASEEERLRREMDDLKTRDLTLNDQIRTLEWKLSQKNSELMAANERIELIVERHQCEVNSLTESLQIKISELQLLQADTSNLSRERSELRARIAQFKQAITDILRQHSQASEKGKMFVSELILNKEEMEKLLVDALPDSSDNKPLSFLQATLSGLRGEIDTLQTQVNEHASAVQTSSLAWKELEAQVQDLRQICRSSAASRAQSDQLMQETDELVSSLQLPQSIATFLSTSSHSIISTTETSVFRSTTINKP